MAHLSGEEERPVTSPDGARPRGRSRRDRGDDGISWDKINKRYIGTLSLGNDTAGKRIRRTVTGKTKTEVKDKLGKLKAEIKAGIRMPATYTVEQCVRDWLESLKLDPGTVASYRGQAEKWIYPKLGARKLKELKATEVERFLNDVGKVLGKRSLMMISSTLRRSIRRAQKHDLIGRNVAELADMPEGQPGRPSRAMTQPQAALVLATAGGTTNGYTVVLRIAKYPQAATHAATKTGELACGTKPQHEATEVSTDLADATCRSCRAQLGLDGDSSDLPRLEALFVLSLTLGMRPGELRGLRWEHVDLDQAVIHVWRSARHGGDVKTPRSRRSLILPKRAIAALHDHRKRQAAERLTAGENWHDNGLVFCHPDGRQYTRDDLNWRFGKMTRRAGLGHWHAHEARHTAVSIMSHNGVAIQDISDTMGHKSTHVTETVYRHVIVPAIRGGASVMDDVFAEQANGAGT